MSLRVVFACVSAAALFGCGSDTAPIVQGQPDAPTVTIPDAPPIVPGGPDAPPIVPTGPDAPPPPSVGADVDSQISINELMAANAITVHDDTGAAPGWVELYNPTDVSIPLAGYALTDDLAAPLKAVFAGELVLPAGGRLVVWLDGAAAHGAHVALTLTGKGGVLGLARPDASFIDRIQYGAQETDFSAAREPDGSDHWAIEWHASPGAANPAGGGAPKGPDVPADPPETVPAAGDLTEAILGYDVMPRIEFVVAPDAVAALLVDPGTYVQAQLVYDGRSYGPVGLRLKGSTSFEPFDHKPSLRINIDQYVDAAKFFGMKDMTLNNMHSDFSMMHERMAYYIARAAGVPASRSNHALVTVNGQFYGLYANVETIKKQMVKRWFSDNSGPLFEATDVDFVASYLPLYDLESGDDDRSLIAGLDQALTIASPDDAMAEAASFVDIHELIRFMALCAVIAQFDSFPYSNPGDDIFLYADPKTGRLNFMPWGMDETFYSGQVDVNNVFSVLATKCLASPACRKEWTDQIWHILALTDTLGLEAERLRIIAQIAGHVADDTRKSYTDAQVTASQMDLHWFFLDRRTNLGTMLPPPTAP
jgi:hypothetical protein